MIERMIGKLSTRQFWLLAISVFYLGDAINDVAIGDDRWFISAGLSFLGALLLRPEPEQESKG